MQKYHKTIIIEWKLTAIWRYQRKGEKIKNTLKYSENS